MERMNMAFKHADSATLPSEIVIRVRELRKVFTSYFDRPGTLKETIVRFGRAKTAHVVALNGISFDIRAGESVAIIGPNGSGKTTLLAILSGVYKPTSGLCEVHGKVVAMLGVSGGFHPELTALDNLLFVGVSMGMNISEVKGKIPSILEFAEIGDVLNAPVRTLSTGMCIRLGFSLGIHASPQIMLVDEQLQATDERFQEKALRKLRELNRDGMTLLFVTHYLPWVRELASRVIWLERGVIRMDGSPKEVVDAYIRASHSLIGA